jgi:hypothetical protein
MSKVRAKMARRGIAARGDELLDEFAPILAGPLEFGAWISFARAAPWRCGS